MKQYLVREYQEFGRLQEDLNSLAKEGWKPTLLSANSFVRTVIYEREARPVKEIRGLKTPRETTESPSLSGIDPRAEGVQ